MTICVDIGKFQTTIQNRFIFGKCTRKVELDITWVSCGDYSITAKPLDEAGSPHTTDPKPVFHINLTPEWIEKVIELYPTATKPNRVECCKPFYEGFDTDRGMFDFGQDTLFRAFKSPHDERVILTTHHFNSGEPTRNIDVFNIEFEEFKRLKAFLDNPNGNGSEIFYSGCKFAWPTGESDEKSVVETTQLEKDLSCGDTGDTPQS